MNKIFYVVLQGVLIMTMSIFIVLSVSGNIDKVLGCIVVVSAYVVMTFIELREEYLKIKTKTKVKWKHTNKE